MGVAAGNATKAARLAGYAKNTAEKQASRLLGKVGIQKAIAERTERDPAAWTRERLQKFWSEIANGDGVFEQATLRERLRASELLARSRAMFIERHDLTTSGQPIVFQVVTNVPEPEASRGRR